MRSMVTGGAGFIGSHVCDRLLEDGHEVWCFDNLETGSLVNLAKASRNPRFHFIKGDVRDGLPDIDVNRIYSLACPASPRHYRRDPVGTLRTSILGILNVLEYCRMHGARMLQSSTSEVYGDPDVHPQPEDYVGAVSCTGPRACYDEGKRAAETLCFDYYREYGVEIRVARLFNTYGPRMNPDDGRVIPNFVVQALNGDPLTIYGAGTQTRSFCYVDDMVDGLVQFMEAPAEFIGPLNLGNPDEFTIRELADLVGEKFGIVVQCVYEPLPQDDPRVRRPDIARARALLDWEPTTALTVGLDKTIAWYRSTLATTSLKVRGGSTDGQQVVAIIGAGPAGLTAGYELLKHSALHHPVILEESDAVGGIARTVTYKDFRFDIGGHRFFTKVAAVNALWHEVLPETFLKRPRLSRIYYKGKYYSYPLKLFNAFGNLGFYESVRILLSYAKWHLRPHVEERDFEQWVTNRFGGRLFWHFFKSYTEKVWGMPCNEIQADWAVQRIKNLSLRKAIVNAITGANDTTSLIESFDYPRLGPGMMWEAFRDRILAKGGELRMRAKVTRVLYDDSGVRALEVTANDGRDSSYRVEADYFISSMPISELVAAFSPPAPPAIQAAAAKLRYRDFLIVTLILDDKDPFPDNWIYVHSPDVKVGRIQNFRSWSQDMVPDPDKSSIGMEYFCQEGDALWTMDDAALVQLAGEELEGLGLAKASDVVDGTVIRQPKAYPVYDSEYREALNMIRGWLAAFHNLQVVGRNGMHRYNNQDHSMMTAMLAVKNILGAENDLWSVNVEQSYHENIEASPNLSRTSAVAA